MESLESMLSMPGVDVGITAVCDRRIAAVGKDNAAAMLHTIASHMLSEVKDVGVAAIAIIAPAARGRRGPSLGLHLQLMPRTPGFENPL